MVSLKHAAPNAPRLTPGDCANILDYQLAVTVFSASEEKAITDIFGRINSSGKQLSPQERRQAGVVTPFASFVRKICAELRGDTSTEVVGLADMPTISIDAPTFRLGYGIRADETFWCKQGIVQTRQLRDSLDEQIVADLAASILFDEPLAVSQERLDEAYDVASDMHKDLNNRLAAYPEALLSQEITTTFSVLQETIEAVDPSPNVLRKTVNPKAGSNPIRTPFYAIFMAFFNLIIREKKRPTAPREILAAMRGLAKDLTSAGHHVKTKERERNINKTYGLIQNHFAHVDPPLLYHGPGLALEFENSLRRSRIETPRYEFKQGLLRLSETREEDSQLVQRLAEVACSIANIGPESTGFIFLGVADSASDTQRVKDLDGIIPTQVGEVFVVGIAREAQVIGVSVEEYVRKFVANFRAAELEEPLKSDLLSHIDTIEFRGHAVVRITVPPQNQMSWVGGKTFTRENSETREANAKQVAAITQRWSTGGRAAEQIA